MNYLALLESGIENWNQWRAENPNEICDLSEQDLSEGYFIQGNFSNVNFRAAQLQRACFIGANLQGANLSKADLSGAYMGEADLREADLSDASVTEANLNRADLRGANLSGTKMSEANTYKAQFSGNMATSSQYDEANNSSSKESISQENVKNQAPLTVTPPAKIPVTTVTPHQAVRTAIKTVPKDQSTSDDSKSVSRLPKFVLTGLPVMAVASLLLLSAWILGDGPSGKGTFLNDAATRQERNTDISATTSAGDATAPALGATAPVELVQSIDSNSQIWAISTHIPSDRNAHREPMVAGGGDNGQITLWNPQTGDPIDTLTGHNIVRTLAISESGEWLVSGGSDGVKVWDLEVGNIFYSKFLRGYEKYSHNAPIESVTISPHGRTFISADADGKIIAWHTETGEPVYVLQDESPVLAVAIAPDGQSFVSGNREGTIRHRDIVSGKEIQSWNGHDDGVRTMAISADGKTLATGSWDSTIKLWSMSTGELQATFAKEDGGHDGQVMSVALSPDGTILASGGTDNQLKRWDLSRGELIETVEDNDDWVLAVAFAPIALLNAGSEDSAAARSQQSLISSGKDRKVNVWQPTLNAQEN